MGRRERQRERKRGERVCEEFEMKTICYRDVIPQCFHYHSDEEEAF